MRKTEALLDALFLTVYQIVSCMVIYFASWMLLKIVDKLVLLNPLAVSAVYAVLLFVGVGVLQCLYAYYSGYKTAQFSLGDSLLASGIAVVMHLLIAAVFNYLPLIAGSARYIAAILANGSALASADQAAVIPAYLPPVLFVLIAVVYHVAMLFLRKMAVNRRLMDRYELTGSVE